MHWIQVARAVDIPRGQARIIDFGDDSGDPLSGGQSVAVFNTGDHFLAIDDCCPKTGTSVPVCSLAAGVLGGTTVTCPMHQWRICLKTGLVIKPVVEGTPQVRTYPVRVENGTVFLGLHSEKAAA